MSRLRIIFAIVLLMGCATSPPKPAAVTASKVEKQFGSNLHQRDAVDSAPPTGCKPLPQLPLLVSELQHADRENVQKVIAQNKLKVIRCNELGPIEDNICHGGVEIRWRIGRDGKVSEAVVARSTLKNKLIPRCLLKVIRGLRFKPPRAKNTIEVTYPFHARCAGD